MNNSKFALNTLGVALTATLTTPLIAVAGDNDKPNVIVILSDDIGYRDFGCYGAKLIKTPSIDKLAKKGVRFTNAYSPASTSSPTRYSLLTGEYAFRKDVSIMPGDAPLKIDPTKATLPNMFQKNGYTTAIVGKWHLGVGTAEKRVDFNKKIEYGASAIGFDYSFYFSGTNDRVPSIFIENEHVVGLDKNDPIKVSYQQKIGTEPTGAENPELLKLKPHITHDGTIVNGVSRMGWMSGGKNARWRDEDMAETFFNKTVEFIDKNQDAPFFIYYAPHNAHEPRIPSEKFRGHSKAGVYGDVIEEFDYYVGKLIEELKERDLYENTIIIISSDNNPMIKEGYIDGALENLNGHNPYGELRGEKYALTEGGFRVPFIVSWPTKVKKGFVQDQPYQYSDLLATSAGLLGFTTSKEDRKDSVDGSKLFLDKDAPIYRPYLVLQNNEGDIAIRQGDWKLIPANKTNEEQLYNLADDPSELRNVRYAFKDKAAELLKFAEETKK